MELVGKTKSQAESIIANGNYANVVWCEVWVDPSYNMLKSVHSKPIKGLNTWVYMIREGDDDPLVYDIEIKKS